MFIEKLSGITRIRIEFILIYIMRFNIQLYDKRTSASETAHNGDDQMVIDIDVQKIDLGTQIELFTSINFKQCGTITTRCSTLLDANSSESLPATTPTLTESLKMISIELPFHRVSQCRRKCFICKK